MYLTPWALTNMLAAWAKKIMHVQAPLFQAERENAVLVERPHYMSRLLGQIWFSQFVKIPHSLVVNRSNFCNDCKWLLLERYRELHEGYNATTQRECRASSCDIRSTRKALFLAQYNVYSWTRLYVLCVSWLENVQWLIVGAIEGFFG